MQSDEFKKGDVVTFVYAQPGAETTEAVVVSANGPLLTCRDIYFDLAVDLDTRTDGHAIGRLWRTSAARLDQKVTTPEHGTQTVRERAMQVLQQLGAARAAR